MNPFAFLDGPSSSSMQRSATPASPSQQHQLPPSHQMASPNPQTNGMLGGGGPQQQNGGGIPMINGLPSGGQQTDMNYLWNMVQQLSQVLEENRAQTVGIVNGVQALQARAATEENGGPVGGSGGFGLGIREVNGEINAATRAAEFSNLQSQLSAAQSTITALSTTNDQLSLLITDYESALSLVLEKLRPHAYTQTTTLLSLHKHYQTLLEQERNTSMQLRLEHADWQAGLGRVAEYARTALKVQGQSENGMWVEIKELKEENRVLRRLAGWEERPGDGSSDEEEGERH